MSFEIEYLSRLEDDLRAAAVRRTPSRRWRRALAPRALLVAAAVLLMGGSLALAFGGRVVTALDGGPAPKKIKSELAEMTRPPYPLDGAPPLPKDYLPGKIVPGSQRRVLSVRTSRGKIASLYVARTSTGKQCLLAVGWPFSGGGCGNPRQPGPIAFLGSGATVVSPTSRALVHWLTGRATSPRAAALRLVFPDGTHRDVALANGWFMVEVAPGRSSRATGPLRAEVLSASGARLGSVRDPLSLRLPRVHLTNPLPETVRLLTSAELPNSGGTVRIWSGRDAQGRNCFRYLRNGKSQLGHPWDCGPMVGRWGSPLNPTNRRDWQRHMAVQWRMGLANDPKRPDDFGYAYTVGWVSPDVARLTLRFQGGGAIDIPLHGRYYLYVVPRANWPAGHRPSILEAHDASGARLYRAFLYPRAHCVYPGRDPACRNLGMGTG